MAAIDKLYADFHDFREFRLWVMAFYPRLLWDMVDPFLLISNYVSDPSKLLPIATFSHRQDLLLLWRCPIPFVRVYLETKCGLKTRWYHKLFWKQ